jgi:uncharacterized SAM-binding protein YcdF (DUF218 family)
MPTASGAVGASMLFVVSKILIGIAQPTAALLLLLVWGCWVRWASFGKRGNRRIAVVVSLLLLAAFTPIANWVLIPLEDRFPRPLISDIPPLAGMIVLGGFLDPEITTRRDHTELIGSGDRLIEAAVLARRLADVPIIVTGGSANILNEFLPEAELAKRLLEDLGVPADRIKIESQSRTTAENASMTRQLLAPNLPAAAGQPVPGRWLLITSAMHMPRSVGTFRHAGFDVVAYPVDYRSSGPADRFEFFQSPARSLHELDNSLKEWAGLFVYWLRGDSDALFPGP